MCTLKVKPRNFRRSFFISPCNESTFHRPTTLRTVEVESYNLGRSLLLSRYNRSTFEDQRSSFFSNKTSSNNSGLKNQNLITSPFTMPRQEPVDKVVFVKVNDETKGFSLAESIEENNAFDASSSDQSATGLEANKVVNDGDGEVKVLNWVQQAIDVESTTDNDARDQVSELETKVLVDGKQDDAKVVVWPMSKTMTSQTTLNLQVKFFKPLSSIMSTITDVKCVLSQKAFNVFYEKFHIPLEVHLVLPSRSDTMHEIPAGKIGLYTSQGFSFGNLVSCLWGYADQEFLCLFGLSRHYTLDEETYPLFLDKDGEDMDIFAFIHTSDPTKVKVVEREQKEDESRLLETTFDRIVPLLPVAPDRGESELGTSVDKLFDESGSSAQAEQGDSTGGGGEQGMNIQTVTETTDTIAEDVIPLQSRRLKKRKTLVADAGGPSHPPKKLRKDHETLSGTSVGGKSMSAVQRLFAGAVQNAEVRGEPILTMPFVTSSVSVMPEREGEDYSHHSGATIVEAEVDSFARPSALVITAATAITSTADPAVVVKEKIVEPSLFVAESTSADGTDPVMAGLADLIGSDFLWNVTNGSHLDDGGVCSEMVDEFAPLKFFASVRGMEHDQLFTKFNVVAAHQMSLSAEVRMRAEYNIKEKRRLKSVVEEKNQLLKARDEEIKNFKAQLLLKDAEAIRLRTEASKLEMLEKSLRDEVNALNERNNILEKECNDLDVKVTDLEAIVVSKERELIDSTAQLTSIKSQNDNLVDQVHELQVSSSELKEKLSNYENLTERLEEFQDAHLKVVNDKFDKLCADFVEMTLHLEERSVNFPLLAELKTNKDASIEAVMNIMRFKEHLAERLGLTELQPHADQLMVPIHHSPDKTVVGASALSLALDVSDACVRRIRENIMSHRYLFQDVFIPLAEPLSPAALTGMKGTSNAVPATADITTALSVTLASTGTVTPLFIDDYGVIGTDDQSAVDEDANPFYSVDDAELNIPQLLVCDPILTICDFV
nr:AIG1-like protein [Tanacetum cinerariifolium]